MNDIVIFKDITTEDHLVELEKVAEKYEGLYVDMNNSDERKFVKKKAEHINQILKQLNRSRIDKAKNYKNQVEEEAEKLRMRLEDANSPFVHLIDQHKAERAKILADEKAAREAKELAIQKEIDHEDAIMQNKVFDFEAEERKLKQAEYEEQLKRDAIEQERQRELARKEAELQRIADEKAAREANIAHVTSICRASKESLMHHAGLTESQAVIVVKSIRGGLINHTTIIF